MKVKFLLLSVLLFFCLSIRSNAQIDILDRAKEKAKDKIQQRVDKKMDEGMDEGLDKAEEGLTNKKDKNGKTNDTDNDEATKEKKKEGKTKDVSKKFESYTQYDFVPGDQILLFEDFEQDAIGDFPALWTGNGTGEVVTTNLFAGKWFHLLGQDMCACLEKNLNLPENFIFEFDLIPVTAEDDAFSFYISLFEGENSKVFLDDGIYPGTSGININFSNNETYVTGYSHDPDSPSMDGNSQINPVQNNTVNHIVIWVQKKRVRIYHKGKKCLDLPSVNQYCNKFNRFRASCWSGEGTPMLKNLRISTTGADTRSKLLTEGKIVSYGIFFDSGADKVKPESYGALNDIAKILNENPQVIIKIVGHTDSDGNSDANIDLSKRRAAEVKNELTKKFGIDAQRIQTDGKGDKEPVGANTTSEGKAKNRRVEFIKI